VAVHNFDVVDIVSLDPDGKVTLTISDHLEWTESVSHQLTLQYDPDASGLAFLEWAQDVIEKAGFGFRHVRFQTSATRP
jgi:hypothetical protein